MTTGLVSLTKREWQIVPFGKQFNTETTVNSKHTWRHTTQRRRGIWRNTRHSTWKPYDLDNVSAFPSSLSDQRREFQFPAQWAAEKADPQYGNWPATCDSWRKGTWREENALELNDQRLMDGSKAENQHCEQTIKLFHYRWPSKFNYTMTDWRFKSTRVSSQPTKPFTVWVR